MKDISSIAFVLITGILSSAKAQENLKSICVKNVGLAEAWEHIGKAVPMFTSCIEPVIARQPMKRQHFNDKILDTVLTLFCDDIEASLNCGKSFTDKLNACPESNDHKLIEVMLNVGVSIIQFGCENRQFVKELAKNPDRLKCQSSKLQDLAKCNSTNTLDHYASNFDFATAAELNTMDLIKYILNLNFDSEQCSNIQEEEDCTVKVFEECEDKTFSETLNSLYNYVNNDIPCEDLSKSPRSTASPGISSFDKAEEELEPICVKNAGHAEALEQIRKVVPMFKSCIEPVIARQPMKYSKLILEIVDTVGTLFCDDIEAVLNCGKSFTNKLNACPESNDQKLIEVMLNVGVSIIQFGCENRQFVKELAKNPDRLKCPFSKLQDLANCTSKHTIGHDASNFDLAKAAGLKNTDLIKFIFNLNFDSRQCSNIQEEEHCTVKVLEKCEDKIFSETLNSLYNYINNDIPCKDMPKSPKSPRSAASLGCVFNVLLLFYGVMTMSF